MNEVTKIHLGRQAFTISTDAYHELKSYIEAIKKLVGEKDVVDEVELRMAELLTEHGINANKVILVGDVDFLKAQLGNPKDFQEDDSDETPPSASKQFRTKRLFRNTSNAMIAGVASGLAEYFGVDVLLIRILFIVAVLVTFGWGILLYIVLWLLVPEAKTPSERLQMAGKPVNVDSLKEIVERADVKGAAYRANATLAGPINNLFRLLLKLVGLFFILFGLSILFGLITAVTYFLVNHGTWQQNNIFPIGLREHILLDIAVLVAGLIALFIILIGIAIFRRKWPIRTWITGTLIGLVFIGLAIGGALAGDVYPNIRDSYNANVHTSFRTLTPFSALNIDGPETNINFLTSNSYSVSLTYYGHPNLAEVKTIVQNKTLTIDSSQFDLHRNCQTICIPNTYNLVINIYSPNAQQLANETGDMPIQPLSPVPVPIYQPQKP
jgi:phage shock protein PspC (stress-responsive transcriptional regulator)